MSGPHPPEDTPSLRSPSDPRERAGLRHLPLPVEHPEQIGPYKILQVLGEGGMGAVYLAEQTKPVHRRVALKIIKLGMDTREVVARFEAEREALALMTHPGIARVLDAGVTDAGRPYFVMEFVPGVAITDYCDKHRMSTDERLRLFVDVCRAVQHAHQKGIIHRDIKPSNVLVTVQDGEPVPKVIDFGVAKATQHRLTERTLFTEQGQLIGTPGYMSPEQAEMSALDIDTRSDIYSLGVLLYELLTGELPFDREELRLAGVAEIQRIIREVDPPKPSTRVDSAVRNASSLGSADPDDSGSDVVRIAHCRRTEPKTLIRQLRGDLDCIVMKCLEKDRVRRYSTADQLSDDICRALCHEPVRARPPGAAYLGFKFLRRHRGAAVAVAAVGLTLVAGSITSWLLYLRAERERVRANAEAARAQLEAAVATHVADFLVGLFEIVDPERARGNTITAREILDRGTEQIRGRFADNALLKAKLMNVMGKVYVGLGLFGPSAELLQGAVEARQRELGVDHPDVTDALSDLASMRRMSGDSHEAVRLYTQVIESRRRTQPATNATLADALDTLGDLRLSQGDYSNAESQYKEALSIRRSTFGEDHLAVAESLDRLSSLMIMAGTPGQEQFSEQAREVRRRVLGENDPDVLIQSAFRRGDEEALRSAIARQRLVRGQFHPEIAGSLSLLANVLARKKNLDGAEQALREALAVYQRVYGPNHPAAAQAWNALGFFYKQQKQDPEAAERAYREALEKTFAAYGPDTKWAVHLLVKLSECAVAQSHADDARDFTVQALRIASVHAEATNASAEDRADFAQLLLRCEPPDLRDAGRALGLARQAVEATSAQQPDYLHVLAWALQATGDLDQAIEVQRRALALFPAADTIRRYDSEQRLLALLREKGDPAGIETILRDEVSNDRAAAPLDTQKLARSLIELGLTLMEHRKLDEAEAAVRECLELRKQERPQNKLLVANAESVLGEVLCDTGRFIEAETLLVAAEAVQLSAGDGPYRERRKETVTRLVKLYNAWNTAEPNNGHEIKAADWRAKLELLASPDQIKSTR